MNTAEGRAAERYRLALWAMVANVANRAVGLLVMLLSVTWTVPYLGAERFGAWMTVASFAAMLSFLDLGIGNALTNHVTRAATSDDPGALRRVVSGGLGLLALVALALCIVLPAAALAVPWASVVKLSSPQIAREFEDTAVTFALLFAVSIPSSGVGRIFVGLQRGFEVHVVGIAGSLAGLAALALATHVQAGLPVLLLCSMGGSLVGTLVLFGLLCRRGHFRASGLWASVRMESPGLLHVGGLYFLIQIATMVGWGADPLIIASAAGASSVAIFSVTQKLFQLNTQPLSVVNAPLWPAYADASSRGDKAFIRRTLRNSMLLTGVLGTAGALVLWAAGEWLVQNWTKGVISVPPTFLAIYALWSVCDALGHAFAMFLNGCNVVRLQVYGVLTLIAVSLPAKYLLVVHMGMEAMLLGFVVIYLLNHLFWSLFMARRDIRALLM